MSVNRYTTQDGLQTLANGQRCWIGTKAAYEAAVQAGTMENDILVAITDDDDDFKTDQVIKDSQKTITSGGVYNAVHGEVLADISNLNVADSADYTVPNLTKSGLQAYDHIVILVVSSDANGQWKQLYLQIGGSDGADIASAIMYGGGVISGAWYYLGLSARISSAGLQVRYQLTNYTDRHINKVKVIGYK